MAVISSIFIIVVIAIIISRALAAGVASCAPGWEWLLGRTGIWGRFDGETLDGYQKETDGCQKETLGWHDSELRRGELECPEREEEGSRKKSESSLILDYLTIQCYAFSVRIDVFSTVVPMLLGIQAVACEDNHNQFNLHFHGRCCDWLAVAYVLRFSSISYERNVEEHVGSKYCCTW